MVDSGTPFSRSRFIIVSGGIGRRRHRKRKRNNDTTSSSDKNIFQQENVFDHKTRHSIPVRNLDKSESITRASSLSQPLINNMRTSTPLNIRNSINSIETMFADQNTQQSSAVHVQRISQRDLMKIPVDRYSKSTTYQSSVLIGDMEELDQRDSITARGFSVNNERTSFESNVTRVSVTKISRNDFNSAQRLSRSMIQVERSTSEVKNHRRTKMSERKKKSQSEIRVTKIPRSSIINQ